jgi:hypothetical protein
MVESLEFEFRLGSAIVEAAGFLACELATSRLEGRDGGGVCIDPGASPLSVFLSLKILSSVLRSVMLVESDLEDEERSRDGSTGGKGRSGFGGKWCT